MLKKVVLLTIGGVFATAAVAQSDIFKADDLVKYRQSIYQVMGAQAKVMGAMVKGEIDFDAEALHQRALNMGNVGKLLGETYVPATRDVEESNILPAAWEDMDGFSAKGKAFGGALEELIAASGEPGFDAAMAKPAVGKLMKSCKACHDDYRE
ncbi:c-type cytochrome [Oceanisphaera psychrotolerans]|uniref:Cytochrome c prime n=1 Tax=Oceanisphaera psychrotolerans TaxID=1414654 RepID=A0A1J4Q9S8_9GAMM|nr:cytochrome c [Oceanisphaera psychrotolerans]OIN04801.1 cytochrome c prime [Oceanisphaera psychrotolerans]